MSTIDNNKNTNPTPDQPQTSSTPANTTTNALGDIANSVSDIAKSASKASALAGGAAQAAMTLSHIGPIIAGVIAIVAAAAGITIAVYQSKLKIDETANIVEEIKKISEFTSACYYEDYILKNEKVVEKKKLFKDEIEMVPCEIVITVCGKVRAGFDLSTLGANDIVIKGDTIDIKLPTPQVFDVISNPSDYSIFEETGEWSHDEIVAMQVKGKENMLANAHKHNILDKANEYGKERISALFETFGFNVINVTLSEIPVVAEEPTTEVAPSETTTTQN